MWQAKCTYNIVCPKWWFLKASKLAFYGRQSYNREGRFNNSWQWNINEKLIKGAFSVLQSLHTFLWDQSRRKGKKKVSIYNTAMSRVENGKAAGYSLLGPITDNDSMTCFAQDMAKNNFNKCRNISSILRLIAESLGCLIEARLMFLGYLIGKWGLVRLKKWSIIIQWVWEAGLSPESLHLQ